MPSTATASRTPLDIARELADANERVAALRSELAEANAAWLAAHPRAAAAKARAARRAR